MTNYVKLCLTCGTSIYVSWGNKDKLQCLVSQYYDCSSCVWFITSWAEDVPYAAFIQIRNESEHKFAGLRSACSRAVVVVAAVAYYTVVQVRGERFNSQPLSHTLYNRLTYNIPVVRESRNKYPVSNNSTTHYQCAACIADAQSKLNQKCVKDDKP